MTSATHCGHHDDVLGIALCVSCSQVLCAACTTRIQGRNLCASCVAQSLQAEPEHVPASRLLAAGVYAGVAAGGLLILGVLTSFGIALHALG